MPPRRRGPNWNTNTHSTAEEFTSAKKTALKEIVQSAADMAVIDSVVTRMHKVTVKTYQFLKLYYLHGLEQEQEEEQDHIPRFDKPLIIEVIRTVAGYEVQERANTNANLVTLRERLRNFYNLYMPDYQQPIDLNGLGIELLT